MKLRVGVVGCGPMGSGHVRHYKDLPGCDLVAVADTDPARRAEAALKSGAMAFADAKDLVGRVDAVSIATPTSSHRALVELFVDAGVHVLVEKPMAPSTADAEAMLDAARRKGVTFQVGHIERFNPAFRAAREVVSDPRYVITDRLSPYAFRSQDISVVLDLMIHDLDIVLEFVRCDVVDLEAIGIPVLTSSDDMCDARLRFDSGAIADLRASRVSMKRMRKIRMFQRDTYLSIDYHSNSISIFRKSAAYVQGDLDPLQIDVRTLDDPYKFVFGTLLDVQEYSITSSDALRDELASFLEACRGAHPPEVTGEHGLRAVRLADRIQAAVGEYLARETDRAGLTLPTGYGERRERAAADRAGRTERYTALDEAE